MAFDQESRRLDFLGVGPQKTATTWLYQALRSSPETCFPRGVKETFFWDRHFDKGLGWYWKHFRHCGEGCLHGEIAPTLLESPAAPKRVFEQYPGCRIIVTLRDPAERVFSLYLHHWRKGRIAKGFSEALADHPWLLEGSRYGKHLENWECYFGKERVLVLFQDEIRERPDDSLARVRSFLGIGHLAPEGTHNPVNAASLPRFPRLAGWLTRVADAFRANGLYRPVELAKKAGLKRVYAGGQEVPALPVELRRELVQEFEEDIAFVEQLTGRSLGAWRQVEDA